MAKKRPGDGEEENGDPLGGDDLAAFTRELRAKLPRRTASEPLPAPMTKAQREAGYARTEAYLASLDVQRDAMGVVGEEKVWTDEQVITVFFSQIAQPFQTLNNRIQAYKDHPGSFKLTGDDFWTITDELDLRTFGQVVDGASKKDGRTYKIEITKSEISQFVAESDLLVDKIIQARRERNFPELEANCTALLKLLADADEFKHKAIAKKFGEAEKAKDPKDPS